MRLPVRAVQRLHARGQGDEGISLLEVIVALMIIAVVMTSAAGFFLNSLKTTGGASQRQTAVTLVNQELESIRAVPPGSLLKGRTNSGNGFNSIVPLFAWSGAAALTSLDDTSNTQSGANNYGTTATASSIPAVPPITHPIVNNRAYTLYNFIDPCWLAVGQAQSTDVSQLKCGSTYSSVGGQTTSMMFRVTVAGVWTGGAATNCTNGCTYSASSLVDPNGDPLFQSNVSRPTITGINPTSIPANKTTTIVVSGAGFVSGATATTCSNATVGTIDQSKNTGTSIQIPIIAGSNIASCSLTITNPDGGNISTTFAISSPPTISSVSPVVQNYTSGSVTITGTNFGAATVSTASGTWSGTSVVSTTKITGSYAANLPGAGIVPVTVTNSDGGSATSNVTVTQSKPVNVTSSTVSVVAGQPTPITLTGSDFAPSGETVSAAGGSVSGYIYGSGSVSFTFLADGSSSTATLSVQNPDGGASSTISVTVTRSTPTVMAVSGRFSSANTVTLTLSGTGFMASPPPTLTLSYGGRPLFTAVVASATNTSAIYVAANSHGVPPGQYPVTVTVKNSDGGSDTENLTLVLS